MIQFFKKKYVIYMLLKNKELHETYSSLQIFIRKHEAHLCFYDLLEITKLEIERRYLRSAILDAFPLFFIKKDFVIQMDAQYEKIVLAHLVRRFCMLPSSDFVAFQNLAQIASLYDFHDNQVAAIKRERAGYFGKKKNDHDIAEPICRMN